MYLRTVVLPFGIVTGEGQKERIVDKLDPKPRVVERRMPFAAQRTDFMVFVIVEEAARSECCCQCQQDAGAYPKYRFHMKKVQDSVFVSRSRASCRMAASMSPPNFSDKAMTCIFSVSSVV